jgi:hypothetical protein
MMTTRRRRLKMPKNARLWLETSAGDELEKKKRAGHHLYAHRYPSPPCEQTELSWFETNKTADPTDCACTAYRQAAEIPLVHVRMKVFYGRNLA